jgi:allantoate deiminase
MIALDPADLGRRAEAMIEELAAISADPDRLVRLYLTPEFRRAADLVAQWMREAGLEVAEDALGSIHGRRGEGPRLLIGSHIDTVMNAGKYDGPLGVVAGILAIDTLQRAGARVPPIELLAFGDEEGSRFPSTLPTSAAVAGVFEPRTLDLMDGAGISFADALRTYGKNPDDIPGAALKKGEATAYVEMHIEQGPLLESKNVPLGIVSAIVGQTRMVLTVTGEAGHAGTVPMDLRRDALAGAAEMTLLAERVAREAGQGMVATVGRIETQPGAINIIPAEVRFTLDLRAPTDAARQDAIDRFTREARSIAERRRLGFEAHTIHELATTPCDAGLQDALAAAAHSLGIAAPRLASGAAHDAMMFAKVCPFAMLFVRCKGGVSHNPAEYASPEDMGLAIAALIRFVERFEVSA